MVEGGIAAITPGRLNLLKGLLFRCLKLGSHLFDYSRDMDILTFHLARVSACQSSSLRPPFANRLEQDFTGERALAIHIPQHG